LHQVAPINDDGDFYVTQWLPTDLGLGDWRYRSVVKAMTKTIYILLGHPLGLKWTRLYHCKGADGECHAVGAPATSWNGITFIPPPAGNHSSRGWWDDGLGHIVAVNAMAKELDVYRLKIGGDVVLERRVAVDRVVDNVRWVPEEQRVWSGGMAIAAECYFGWHGDHAHGRITPTGGGPAPVKGTLCPAHATSIDAGAL
jgi:hypothetical protein